MHILFFQTWDVFVSDRSEAKADIRLKLKKGIYIFLLFALLRSANPYLLFSVALDTHDLLKIKAWF